MMTMKSIYCDWRRLKRLVTFSYFISILAVFFLIFSFNIQADLPQNMYKYSMNGWLQVITGVEFNRKAATHLI